MNDSIVDVAIELIDVFIHQSREQFCDDDIANLAEDIKVNGLLQPGVGWLDPGRQRYVLLAGERRFRAIRLAGLPTMALKLMQGNLTQSQMLQINLSENLQRANLNAIERAKAFRRYMQLEGVTARETALRFHVSDALVSRDLSLLDLPGPWQAKVISGELPASIAALIVKVSDEETRRHLVERCCSGRATRSDIEAEVRRLGRKAGRPSPCRLAGSHDGVTFTLSGERPMDWDVYFAFLAHLQREGKRLRDAGEDISALGGRRLRAS